MNDDDELRRELQDSMRRAPGASAGDLSAVARRARSLRVRRVIRGTVAAGVICAAVATPLVLLSPLGSPGRDRPPAAVGTGPGSPSPSVSPGTGVIHIERVVEGGGHLVYIEGALAYVKVLDESGSTVVQKQLPNYFEDWSGDLRVPPGNGVLESFVRICGGNCGNLGPPAELCSSHVAVVAGETTEATITYRPGSGCSIDVVDRAAPTETIPTPLSPECGVAGGVTGFRDYVAGARGLVGDPVDLARDHFQGLLETDEVQLVSQTEDQATVAVVRDGTIIATAEYASDGQGGWLLSQVTRCQDSGLIG